jgi:hypothetical protein
VAASERRAKAGYGLHVTANLDVHDYTVRTQQKAAGLIQVINDVSLRLDVKLDDRSVLSDQ